MFSPRIARVVASPPSKTAERLGSSILVVFLVAFGWFTLLVGEISLKGKSGSVSQLSGSAAVVASLVFFALAAVLVPLLVRSFGLRIRSGLVLALLAVLPPLLFLAGKSLTAAAT